MRWRYPHSQYSQERNHWLDIVEMATTSGLNRLSGRDIRLIALNIGDKEITDPAIEDSLAFSQNSVQRHPLPCCQIATTRRRLQPRCNGESAAFSRHRSRSKSLSPDYAWFLPAGSTDRYRSSGKMERRASRRYRNTPRFPSYAESTRVTAPPRSCRRGRWSTLRHANNTCSRRCSSAFPTS